MKKLNKTIHLVAGLGISGIVLLFFHHRLPDHKHAWKRTS